MRVKILRRYSLPLQILDEPLANLILIGKISINNLSYAVRTSHPIYYIYALRKAYGLRSEEERLSTLLLLEQDITKMPPAFRCIFKTIYNDYRDGDDFEFPPSMDNV